MRQLFKSKMMAFRQCAKRLWLEIHHAEWRDDSPASQARFDEGNAVGDIARKLYDPAGVGSTLDPHQEGWTEAFARTAQLLQTRTPVFEAPLSTTGALALADVLLPAGGTPRQRAWRMIEVKSSTSVKDTHRDDLAFQAFVAQAARQHAHAARHALLRCRGCDRPTAGLARAPGAGLLLGLRDGQSHFIGQRGLNAVVETRLLCDELARPC